MKKYNITVNGTTYEVVVEEAGSVASAPVFTAPAAPVVPVQEVVQTTTSDAEIVAVIAAAIAMAESESIGTKFQVVSFKRK